MMIQHKKRVKNTLIALLISALLVILGYSGAEYELFNEVEPGYFKVTQVEDGDTITVNMNGKNERVRFIGIDTPETKDPRKPVQCFGRAASNFANQLFSEGHVRLESDPLSSNRDRYNRLLRYVYLPDGRLAQKEIIIEGYGFAYTSFPFTKSSEFLNYQKEAREQNRGLWNACQPTTNDYGGFDSNPE
jgi:endonuclease YncB( thermonuclease family)